MKKTILLLLLGLIISLFFVLDLQQFLSFDYIKQNQEAFQQFYTANSWLTLLLFFFIYTAVTALSLPGAAVMTLAGGALFGFTTALFIISFASTIGATLAFFCSRFLLRDLIQARFSKQLISINEGIKKEGAFYLFTLRLVPLFPFFLINLVMGLTPIRGWTFYWVSQVGMLAGTAVYVNAGTQLGQLESASGIFSPQLILSFALLGVFPLIAKKMIQSLSARKLYRKFQRPKTFDTNLVVIGAGAAGLVTAYISAAVKAKVILIEKHRMGGDCLNTGCVPSKALIRSARFIAESRKSHNLGIKSCDVEFDFAEIMQRVQQIIQQVEPHDSVERYTELGVNFIQGEAEILSPYQVKVNDQIINTRNIVIATGARPTLPNIPGLEQVAPLTSDNLWSLRQLPERLLVIGGGPIGCELSQCFSRFGSDVTMLLRGQRPLPREDEDIAHFVSDSLVKDGLTLITEASPIHFEIRDGQKILHYQQGDSDHALIFDQVLIATGRTANTSGFGLESLNIKTNDNRTINVNKHLQTNYPNIYACGDVAGPYQFTHTAAHQAWYCAVNALFGQFKLFNVDYSVIPAATFTDPELARVGLNELEAQQQGIEYEVTRYNLSDLDRAITESEAYGEVKVLTPPGKDRILGATVVGPHAGELITEFINAMRHNYGLNKILGTIHIYPTFSEANKFTAGEWKKGHTPKKLLKWLERYHQWRRN